MDQTITAYRAAAASSSGRLVFLERNTAEIAGRTIIGATLWTDFALFGADRIETAMQQAAYDMNDFRDIACVGGCASRRFMPSRNSITQWHSSERNSLPPRLRPCIVVTHHSPSYRSVPDRFKNDLLSAAYSSHLDDLVERSGAALWIHGQTHDGFDYFIGGRRVVRNPGGYYGHSLNRDFNPALVIEIRRGAVPNAAR